KVTFTLPSEIVAEATSAVLLGDFNNWEYSNGISLKKQKDGSMKVSTTLEGGKTYQYRYLLNDGRWVNDQNAENFVLVEGLHVENCVITVPAAEIKTTKVKKISIVAKVVTEDVVNDLTKIEGIGKKINEMLAAENILTFKDLSKLSAKKLKSILDTAGNKFATHNPSSWAKQAKLAAAGKWDELNELKKELNGGK
ncbi:MAG: glycoside hydrolase family 13, partial [Chitinophagaceae bacterium]